MRRFLIAVGVVLAMSCAGGASATTVYVTSIGYSEVQLIVNGSAVRALRIGDVSPEGVRLTGINRGTALLEVDGKAISLTLGQSSFAQTSLNADASGHFVVTAYINGIPVRSIIDTGATHVSLNSDEARRMGIDLTRARRSVSQTANGAVPVYIVNLARVQVGDIVLANVSGSIVEGGAAQHPVALIGMSFLKQIEMRRSGSTMILLRPHF